MRLTHFETLQPVCPRCLYDRQISSPLKLAQIVSQENNFILEGLLHCSDTDCRMEYPIIDGIPIIVRNIRQYISDNLFHISLRDNLSDTIQSVLGDCAGPSTVFDATRQHLSSYGWDHYGDLISDNAFLSQSDAKPGSIVNCLQKAMALLPEEPENNMIDLGCSVGRTSFELAQKTQGLVLGVDMNFSMLRLAQQALQKGEVKFPLRRIGIVYDEIKLNINFKNCEHLDFWVCDALALPFNDASFQLATGFNLLDSVNSPHDLLLSIERILQTQGYMLLSTPYDWSPLATPLETWIGGHSQRGPDHGAAEPLLKALLTSGEHAQSLTHLKLIAEVADHPWWVRVHDRSSTLYKTHIIAAEKTSA